MHQPKSGSLESLISLGESETVEFKSHLPLDAVVGRILIAFSNASGGVLLIGVDDAGSPIGIPDAEASLIANKLKRLSSSLCEWSTNIGIGEVEGKKIVFIEVPPAPPHLSPAMTSSGHVFSRRGVTNRELLPEETLALVRKNRGSTLTGDIAPTHDRPCIIFVAMSFREEQEPALVDYFSAMARAVTRAQLPIELRKMDLMEGDYEISQRLMDEIRTADVIIADFTLNSANVLFEVGFARGCNKRIIQTARKDTRLDFDVRNWRTVVYRNATELEEKLVLELKAAHAEVMEATPLK